jgi:hypothetical protein
MLKLQFLEASVPLTKTFTLGDKGELIKTPYPMVKKFTSHEELVSSSEEFRDKLIQHAALGHCLLKGALDRALINESRAGHTSPDSPTEWVVLDVDGLPYSPEEFLHLIGYGDVDYIVQYSASSGIILTGEACSSAKFDRYHIFIRLDEPQPPYQLKLWLKKLNLSVPAISQYLDLTASSMSMRWPLDISVCQNDKLIYIAPPQCGPGVIDTLSEKRL